MIEILIEQEKQMLSVAKKATSFIIASIDTESIFEKEDLAIYLVSIAEFILVNFMINLSVEKDILEKDVLEHGIQSITEYFNKKTKKD